MAPRGSKKVKEPAPYAEYLEKEPTDLQDHLTGWLLDKTGYEPENADDFAEGVRLCVALRMTHQASPENQERRAASEERSEMKAQAAKRKADEEDETPAPKRRGRPPKAKVVEEDETPAPKRRGRPPKAKPEEVEVPKTVRKPPVKGRAKPADEDF